MEPEPKSQTPQDAAGALSVLATLKGKNILLTGATGFVGKVVLEKILRSVPTINSVFVLVRPRKGSTTQERLEAEVISSAIFTRLRSERKDFDDYVRSKVVPVAGELTQSNVGFSEETLEMLYDRLDVIIHCAAIVDFNERLDRAIELNVLGTLRLMDIAKRCRHIGAFVHISTAYVNSNRRGWIDEKVYPLGFDPEQVLKNVANMQASELDKITVSGLLGEWPNTYTFTKAMTETLLLKHRGKVPLAIVRPSIIGAAWKEPVPGWIDVISAAAAVYVAVGLGVLKFLPGTENSIADITPVDYVVNTILTALPSIFNQDRAMVLQACTSVEKPVRWGVPLQVILNFFRENPPPSSIGKPSFRFIKSPQLYQLEFFLRYSIPSSILTTIAAVAPNQKSKAAQFSKLVWRVRVIIESFRHFVENEWLFDNKNTRACWQQLTPQEKQLFFLDLTDLHWQRYNLDMAYGLMLFVFKDDFVPVDKEEKYMSVNKSPWDPSESVLDKVFYDVAWVAARYNSRPPYPIGRQLPEMYSAILSTAAVQQAMRDNAAQTGRNITLVEGEAKSIMEKMFGDASLNLMTGLGWGFRKIWRRLYENILVEEDGIGRVKRLAEKSPIVFIPTHRSYIDFLIISYICFACNLPLPYIAAGEDFLGILLVRYLFRKSGAFFLRRSFMSSDNKLYAIIFREYVQRLLCDGQSLEFFVEGTRSRSGKMLHPKLGLLSIITGVYLDKKIPDLVIVPVSINYEKTIEGDLYSSELLGENKIRESLRNLLSSRSVLNVNFGKISVVFGNPISMKDYTSQKAKAINSQFLQALPASLPVLNPFSHLKLLAQSSSASSSSSSSASSSSSSRSASATATATPSSSSPSSSSPSSSNTTSAASSTTGSDSSLPPPPEPKPERKRGFSLDTKVVYSGELEPGEDTSKLVQTGFEQKGSSGELIYDPYRNAAHRKHFNRALAYEIVYSLAENSEAMVTHLVATLLLMYRNGITRAQLTTKVDWLRKEIVARGGHMSCVQGFRRAALIDTAVEHLQNYLVKRGQTVFEPAISARHEYKNMLVLGHYRNRIVHLFFREGLWAVALYSFGTPEGGVDKSALLSEVIFLHALLSREFIIKPNPDQPEDFEASLAKMIKDGILKSTDGRIEVASTGETHFSFLCALFWPFIDSYFVASMILFSLQPARSMEESLLLQRTQWLATTLYHESMLCFYESCSLETLRNAFWVLQQWKVVKIYKVMTDVSKGEKREKVMVQLLPPFETEEGLQELLTRINRLRKQPPVVKKNFNSRSLIADIPILAKI